MGPFGTSRDEVRDRGRGPRSSFVLPASSFATGWRRAYFLPHRRIDLWRGSAGRPGCRRLRGELGIVAAAGHAPQPIQQDFEATVAGAPQVARIARVVNCRWAGSGRTRLSRVKESWWGGDSTWLPGVWKSPTTREQQSCSKARPGSRSTRRMVGISSAARLSASTCSRSLAAGGGRRAAWGGRRFGKRLAVAA